MKKGWKIQMKALIYIYSHNISIYNQSEALRCYAESAMNMPNLDREQELELIKKVQAYENDKTNSVAQDARNILLEAYLKVVFKTLAYGYRLGGIQPCDIEDLLHDGVEGLCEAIYKYDVCRKAGFSTCARFWIRKRISESIVRNQSLMVRKSEKFLMEMNKQAWMETEFRKIHGRMPKQEELADMTGFSVKKTRRLLNERKISYVSLDAVKQSATNNSNDPISWDEFIADENQESIEEYVINRIDDYTYCEKVLSLLNEKIDKRIMDFIFKTPYNVVSHQNIADEMVCSRQHVDNRIKCIRKILERYGYGKKGGG